MGLQAATTSSTPFTLELTAAARLAICLAWHDGTIGFVKVGPTLTGFSSGTATFGNPHGTLKLEGTFDAYSSISHNYVTFTDVPSKYNYGTGGVTYRMPDGSLAQIIHTERWALGNQQNFYGAYSLMKSTNNGSSWTYLGEFLTPSVQFSNAIVGDAGFLTGASVQIGDYLYLWITETPVIGTFYNSVARCSVASFISAVAANTVPVCKKWDGSGYTGDAFVGTGVETTPRLFTSPGVQSQTYWQPWAAWYLPTLDCAVGCGVHYWPDGSGGFTSTFDIAYTRDAVHWSPLQTISDPAEKIVAANGVEYALLMPADVTPVAIGHAMGNKLRGLYTYKLRSWDINGPEIRSHVITFHPGPKRTRATGAKGGANAAYAR